MDIRRIMHRGVTSASLTALIAGATPALSVSLPAIASPDALPEAASATLSPAPRRFADNWAAGSTALVPVVATDAQAIPISTVDAPADGDASGGKPVDDIQFVRQATESGRHEVQSARDALPQLKRPELRQIAEMMVADHADATSKLTQIAENKGWPVSGPRAPSAPPSGTAATDFDSKWTAEMIEGHERSVALYRAQASGGEDKDLRKYASETLPTIERHLAQLRSLQK
jgi:putative membrane protein